MAGQPRLFERSHPAAEASQQVPATRVATRRAPLARLNKIPHPYGRGPAAHTLSPRRPPARTPHQAATPASNRASRAAPVALAYDSNPPNTIRLLGVPTSAPHRYVFELARHTPPSQTHGWGVEILLRPPRSSSTGSTARVGASSDEATRPGRRCGVRTSGGFLIFGRHFHVPSEEWPFSTPRTSDAVLILLMVGCFCSERKHQYSYSLSY